MNRVLDEWRGFSVCECVRGGQGVCVKMTQCPGHQ